jgi:hypothetical protein
VTAGSNRQLPLPEEEKLLERQLVTRSQIDGAPRASARRAFYEYWSALEHEEWTVVLSYFPGATQRTLGVATLLAALRIEATNNHPVLPLVRDVRTERDQTTSVRYYVRRGDGTLRATSLIWRRDPGGWYIAYSPTLSDSYTVAVALARQSGGKPLSKTAAEAARVDAARALSSVWLRGLPGGGGPGGTK